MNAANFKQKARDVHGSLYNYSKAEYKTAKQKVTITCSQHGDFEQTPSVHVGMKAGCPTCAYAKKTLTVVEFVERATNVHNSKYDYSKVDYKSALTKVTIICPEHGDFDQTPSCHINNKQGCPSCGSNKKVTVAEFVERAKKKHDTLSTSYNYSKVLSFKSTTTKVEIICNLHGPFFMTPKLHMAGQGCKKCSSNFSYVAIAWLEHTAKTRGIQIKHALRGGEEHLKINGVVYPVDGFCADLNTVFQFSGDFFHGNPDVYAADDLNKKLGKTYGELYQRTKMIEALIVSQGYRLETIWEKDWLAFCKAHNLNPREPCQNPDKHYQTADEKKKINYRRGYEGYKERLTTDPQYRSRNLAKKRVYMATRRRLLKNQSN